MQNELTIIPPEMNSNASFVKGGGQMGDLIRAFDWSKTSLGDADNWSQSLRNTIALILNNRFPMLLWWGQEYISIYNDAYIPVLGTKHPWGLGKPVKECWSEIWNILKPLIDTPFKGGEATWMDDISLLINRKNFIEETHFTIAYSPVPDATAPNGIGGVLATVNEITESVIEKRQMETLKELGKNLSSVLVENEVYNKAAEALGINLTDLPFSLIYKIENDESKASLIAASGIEKDHPELIQIVDLNNPIIKTKNVALAANENKIVESENDGRWKDLPKGVWDTMPQRYIHIPIKIASKKFPCAILSVGLNPYRQFNDSYKNFVKLIADQLSLGISNALVYEAERKRAEGLAEIDKAKTVFFSNISHEFRTPLTLMLGPLEDLLNRAQSRLTDEEKNNIETTHRNSMRLLRLVNNLLDFSRIEAGRAKAQFQLTDISTFTRDLAGSFRSAIENAGLHFNVNCEDVIQPMYVDRAMWEKIVLNLLSNAFKYTLTGSITISLSIKNDKARLSIVDTGVGIPPEELPNLFQRFHRVQNVTGRTYEGTGIGLSLVSEFVKIHGGNISVNSKINSGSEFVVTIPTGKKHLPVEQIDESDIDPQIMVADAFLEEAGSLMRTVATKKTDRPEPTNDASSILIVDDNPDMREYLKNILGRNFTVITAGNGIEALQKMKEQLPQLIVSDVMMPGMDGTQLLKAIKENKEYERIPVILLTARAGEESRIEGYQGGADDYLVKPFSTKELLARITTQLSMRKKIEENEKQLEYFIKKAPVGIAIYRGPDFIVEAANDRVLEMWGKTLDEVKGRTLTDIFPKIITEDYARQLYETSVEKFLKGETFVVNEVSFKFDRNGQPYEGWYNCTYEPIQDSKNNTTGIIAVVNEVTDQVVARKKIEESEERFRTLATEFPLFVWLTNEKLQTTFLNKTGLDYFNVSQETDLAELSWKKFIHPADIDRVLAVMNDAAEKQRSYTLTMRLKNGRTGKYRWFVDNGMPQFANGHFTGFIGTTMDIHDEKTADQKIRQSEERFRFLFDSNVLPIAFWHISGEIYDANDSFLNLMGYTREEMHEGQLNWRKFTVPEDAPMHEERVRQAVEGKTIPPYEAKYVNKSGEFISSLVGYAMLTGSKERGIAFMQDIRKIKEVESALRHSEEKYRQLSTSLEEKVKQRTEELSEKNEQLNQAQQIAHLGNWEWNMGKNEILWSDEMYSIYGYGEERFAVTIEKATERMSPGGAENVIDRMKGYVAEARRLFHEKGVRIFYNPAVDYSIVLPDGSKKILRGGGKIILDDHGEISRIIGTVQDITENTRQIEELRKLNEADKLKSDFIKMASHELKTPVTSIKGYTQLLLSALKEQQEKLSPLLVKSSLVSVDKQITRLTRLMSELLDLSKIETGMLVMNNESFHLNELVIETVQDILYTNSKHSISIFHDFECDVYGDKDRLGQVLINFLTNAIKYSPAADKVEVWIKQSANRSVSVSVKDFGIGIDKKDHEKIFERFYRAGGKEEQTFPGFGIGLFIAKEIILRHSGTIHLTSERGKGSVFTFTLPTAGSKLNKNE